MKYMLIINIELDSTVKSAFFCLVEERGLQ